MLMRIPVRTNTDDRYFTDPHQALPAEGYTRIFENMYLNNPKVRSYPGQAAAIPTHDDWTAIPICHISMQHI